MFILYLFFFYFFFDFLVTSSSLDSALFLDLLSSGNGCAIGVRIIELFTVVFSLKYLDAAAAASLIGTAEQSSMLLSLILGIEAIVGTDIFGKHITLRLNKHDAYHYHGKRLNHTVNSYAFPIRFVFLCNVNLLNTNF